MNINRRDKINFFFVILFFIFIIQGIFLPKNLQGTERKTFFVKEGDGVFDISDRLEKNNLIKNSLFFDLYVLTSGNYKKLQAGQYSFNQNMSVFKIAQNVVNGNVEKDIITIPEGWNLRDIDLFFKNNGLLKENDFIDKTGLPATDYSIDGDYPNFKLFNKYDFLKEKPRNISLEGYIFPDTYELKKGFTAEDFIKKALNNFNEKISKNLKDKIKNDKKTTFEIITMASLIEREAREVSDKRIISGILWKRLRNRMPLQVDATILYLTGKTTDNIFKKDLKTKSPYNTYLNRGLPLGPISNPGLESILSSINPQESDYWYYLSTADGKIIFSKTLKEHNIAKTKYLYK